MTMFAIRGTVSECKVIQINTEVAATTLVILILSAMLAVLLTSDYLRKRTISLAMWSSGMWAFSFSVAMEVVFSFGIYDSILIRAYLFLVAFLVELLAMGSMALLQKRLAMVSYVVYSLATTVFLVIALAVSDIGNLLLNGVVYGPLPLLVTIGSSLLAFPAAIILVVVSIISYRKTRVLRLVSIIIGVIVVSAAGTLYIASFPAFLYLAEFIGILLLWIGFIDFGGLFSKRHLKRESVDREI